MSACSIRPPPPGWSSLAPGPPNLLVRHDGVRQERQVAAALDGGGHFALVPRAVARDAAGDDLAALGDEVLQVGRVLVVDLEILVGAVAAHLAPAEAAAAHLAAAAAIAAVAPVIPLVAAAAAALSAVSAAAAAAALPESHFL